MNACRCVLERGFEKAGEVIGRCQTLGLATNVAKPMEIEHGWKEKKSEKFWAFNVRAHSSVTNSRVCPRKSPPLAKNKHCMLLGVVARRQIACSNAVRPPLRLCHTAASPSFLLVFLTVLLTHPHPPIHLYKRLGRLPFLLPHIHTPLYFTHPHTRPSPTLSSHL